MVTWPNNIDILAAVLAFFIQAFSVKIGRTLVGSFLTNKTFQVAKKTYAIKVVKAAFATVLHCDLGEQVRC